MKRLLIFIALASGAISSCKKDTQLTKSSLTETVFQGKYLGEGCWTVIQVIKPSLSNIGLPASGTLWGKSTGENQDTIFQNAIGAGLIPESFRNGDTFYFTVSKLDSNMVYPTYCLPTKYYLTIKTISFENPGNDSGTK